MAGGAAVSEELVDIDGDGKWEGYNATFRLAFADTGRYVVRADLVCKDGRILGRGVRVPLRPPRRTVNFDVSDVEAYVESNGPAVIVFGFVKIGGQLESCDPPYRYFVSAWKGDRHSAKRLGMFDQKWEVASTMGNDGFQ
jgi:hypothetical protein